MIVPSVSPVKSFKINSTSFDILLTLSLLKKNEINNLKFDHYLNISTSRLIGFDEIN